MVSDTFNSSAGLIHPRADIYALKNIRIGYGAYREVFDLGDAVLKCPRPNQTSASFQIEAEVKFYDSLDGDDDQQYFAAVLAAAPDFSWLVMEKAEPMVERYREQVTYEQRKIRDEEQARFFTFPETIVCMDAARRHKIPDLHSNNFGLNKEGRIVVIDYGFAGGF